MAIVLKVRGVSQAAAAIRRRQTAFLIRLTRGLKKAGLYLQRESMKIVPIDTGNLRASAFTEVEDENSEDVVVNVGYTAAYALYVHENLDAWHKPGKSAKFLEGPARELADELGDIVLEEFR